MEQSSLAMYKTFHSHPEAVVIGLFISKKSDRCYGGRIEVEVKDKH